MHVEVKLFATLRKPDVRQGQIRLTDGATVGDLLQRIEIPPADAAIVLVNGKHAQVERQLQDGDVIALFPPIAGG